MTTRVGPRLWWNSLGAEGIRQNRYRNSNIRVSFQNSQELANTMSNSVSSNARPVSSAHDDTNSSSHDDDETQLSSESDAPLVPSQSQPRSEKRSKHDTRGKGKKRAKLFPESPPMSDAEDSEDAEETAAVAIEAVAVVAREKLISADSVRTYLPDGILRRCLADGSDIAFKTSAGGRPSLKSMKEKLGMADSKPCGRCHAVKPDYSTTVHWHRGCSRPKCQKVWSTCSAPHMHTTEFTK